MCESSTIDHLVVYGTLLREAEHPCHAILAELCEFAGPARFRGQLYDLGEYPGARITNHTSHTVRGELYRLLDARQALVKLDAYESHDPLHTADSLFRREAVDVTLEDGAIRRAWVYCYNRSVIGKPRIPSGDYLLFLRTTRARRGR